MWGSSATDVWALDDFGEVFRYAGSKWQKSGSVKTRYVGGIWGTGPNDVWVWGEELVHWDGSDWTTHALPVNPSGLVRGVHGTSPKDLWAVGDNGVWRYDGARWRAVSTGLEGYGTQVLAVAPNDVYIASRGEGTRVLLHWDGATWSEISLPLPTGWQYLSSLWASGPDDLWAAGSDRLFHRGPNGWRLRSPIEEQTLFGVHAVSASEVWAVGANGVVLRSNGQQWEHVVAVPRAYDSDDFTGVSAAGGSVWIVGSGGAILRSTGGAFEKLESPAHYFYTAVFALSASDVWIVSTFGTVSHWDGTALTPEFVPNAGALFAVWASARNDVWVGGEDGHIFHSNGTSWAETPSGVTHDINGLWGFSASEVFAAAGDNAPYGVITGTALRWGGSSWVALPGADARSYTSVWGSSPTDLVFSALGAVMKQWNGTTMVALATPRPNTLYAITGLAGGPRYAVGFKGTIFKTAPGGASTNEGPGTATSLEEFSDVWGFSQSDIWAVGNSGYPRNYDGSRWWVTEVPGTTTSINGDLTAVWGASPSDVWALGKYGRIVHWDGASWTLAVHPLAIGMGRDGLRTIWGSASNDVWVGGSGVLAQWNGTGWSATSIPAGTSVASLFGTAANDVWAAGTSVSHYNGSAWSSSSAPVVPSGTVFDSIWCSSSTSCWLTAHTGAVPATLLRWNGSQWSATTSPSPTTEAMKVWGRGANDVFLFTNTGTYHWDGAAFSPQRLGAVGNEIRAWGNADGIWATGARGALLFHPP